MDDKLESDSSLFNIPLNSESGSCSEGDSGVGTVNDEIKKSVSSQNSLPDTG